MIILSSMCILYNLKFYHCLLVSLPVKILKIFSCEDSLSIAVYPGAEGCNIQKELRKKRIPTQMLLLTLEYS